MSCDSATPRERLPHAILDRDTRVHKARKIVELVGHERFGKVRSVLEIGCGSGVIANTLAELGAPGIEVHAVDVIDNRIETTGYAFELVEGTALPYPDGRFDLVITNHVIEHVGAETDQLAHLAEIRRVLADDGLVYLAVPNKWRLVEPHYRLPLLSWLPRAASDAYVRMLGKGTHYDCEPLAFGDALRLFVAAGFSPCDRTIEALRATLAIERATSPLTRLFNRFVPDRVARLGMGIMPTYIFLLRSDTR